MASLYHPVPSTEFQFDSSGNPVINTGSPDTVRKHLHLTFLGLVACLLWNVIAVATLWIQGGLETTSLILPVAVFVIGVPAAYLSWYCQLDVALADDKPEPFSFQRFFFFFHFHTVFCLFAATGPPVAEKSFTGFMSVLAVSVKDHWSAGVCYMIGFGLFCVESVVSISLLHVLLRVLAWPYPSTEDEKTFSKKRMKRQLFLAWFSISFTVVTLVIFTF